MSRSRNDLSKVKITGRAVKKTKVRNKIIFFIEDLSESESIYKKGNKWTNRYNRNSIVIHCNVLKKKVISNIDVVSSTGGDGI